MRYIGCFEHDKNDNAQNQMKGFGRSWPLPGSYRTLCQKKATDQGNMMFGIRRLSKYKFECITELKNLKMQTTSTKCTEGVGEKGENIQSIYTIMC